MLMMWWEMKVGVPAVHATFTPICSPSPFCSCHVTCSILFQGHCIWPQSLRSSSRSGFVSEGRVCELCMWKELCDDGDGGG